MLRCDTCDNIISPLAENNLCDECRKEQEKKREYLREKNNKWRNDNRAREKFLKYRKTDVDRGRIFDISFDWFKDIVESDCFYCGRYDNPNGIDRLDSSLGHIIENCVPCCKRCNQMKWDMPLEEFKEHVKLIYFHLIEKDEC